MAELTSGIQSLISHPAHCKVLTMFSRSSHKGFRLSLLSSLLICGLCVPVAVAENRGHDARGHHHSVDHSQKSSGWSREAPSSRSWSREAPDKRSWSRSGTHSYGISHGDHHSYGISGRHENKLDPKPRHKPHHGKKHSHHNDLGGIKGHPSFGYTEPHHYRRHGHHHNHGSIYYSRGFGISVIYALPLYRDYQQRRSTVINSYNEPVEYERPVYDYSINPWDELADYQYHTARYAFEAQIQQQPHAALPRVGLSLSTALAGELDAAAFAMQDALLSDTSDLRFFTPDPSVQLILEELLLSYEDDPLMTASLHYLNRNYRAADRAVRVAASYCQPCTAVDNLNSLITAQY